MHDHTTPQANGVPDAAMPHLARAALACRWQLQGITNAQAAEAAARAAQRERAAHFNLLHRVAALAASRRFDDAATTPGAL